jgi:immune inhibitor A
VRRSTGAAVAITAAATLAVTAQLPATASNRAYDGATARSAAATQRVDNHEGPQTRHWLEQRKAALAKVAAGKAKIRANGTVTLDAGTRNVAEVEFEKQDRIFTILAEFGDQSLGKYGTDPGPLHNAIPQPDRAVDNSTTWEPNYNKAYYKTLFNADAPAESMKSFYEKLSSGKYSVRNTVTSWVKVPWNESYYGDNAVEDFGGSWAFIQDTGDAWYDKARTSMTNAEVNAYLKQFDVWDRYDFDNDGNFDEGDGYIDHFQAVHAGEGEDAGGGAQGEDAIWSHRWFVNATDFGLTGPTVAGESNLSGGARIGNSRYWLGDYTTEPENGGLGVFAHEFGHDLGLPDYYDTAGGENSTAFWTLMSSGSWLGHGAAAGEGIGTTPGLMGPEEKLFLGWLDVTQVPMGDDGSFRISPAQNAAGEGAQAIKVNLPDKTTSTEYTTPPTGANAWWTGSADTLNETLKHNVPAASRVTVKADAWYDIEEGYDYLYGEYSTDGGDSWLRAGKPVTGSSSGKWSTLQFSYEAGDQPTQFRFRYQTDGGVHYVGAFLDDIVAKSGGTVLFSDPVNGAGSWTETGLWELSSGTVTKTTDQYYLLENRQWHNGYDDTLRTGPYQFSFGLTAPNKVEFFSFRPGMLVWYVDHSFEDNNTSEHEGGGLSLPVDARPLPFTYPDGTKPSNRRQPFDATFDLVGVPKTCLHKEVLVGNGQDQHVETVEACPAEADRVALPTFDDTNPLAYFSDLNPLNGVIVAGHGVTATVTGHDGKALLVSVDNPPPPPAD